MKLLETSDIECNLIIDGKVYPEEGDAYGIGKKFLKQLAATIHKEFEIKLIKPPQFEDLTPQEIELLKNSESAAFLAVHIGLTSYQQLGIGKDE